LQQHDKLELYSLSHIQPMSQQITAMSATSVWLQLVCNGIILRTATVNNYSSVINKEF